MIAQGLSPVAPTPTWTWEMIAGLVAGAIVMAAGLAAIRAGRQGRRVSPTRLTAGVCGLILGYHIAAWSMPPDWLTLRVPFSRWWVVAVVVVTAMGGSLLADRLERRVTGV